MGPSITKLAKPLKRFVSFGLDTGIASLFTIAVIAGAAKSATIEQIGLLSLIMVIVTAQTQIVTLGLDKLVYARASRKGQFHVAQVRSLISITIFSGVMFYFVGAAAAYYAAGGFFAAVYAAGALRIIVSFSEILRAGYRGELRPQMYIRARLSSAIIASLLLFINYLSSATIFWFSLTWAIEAMLFSVFMAIKIPGVIGLSFRPRFAYFMLYRSFPNLLQMLFVAIYYRFDQLYISLRVGAAELGIYSIAARIAEAGNMIFGLISLMITPMIVSSIMRSNNKSSLFYPVGIFIGFSVIFFVVAYLMGPLIINILFGDLYIESINLFLIYVLAAPFTALGFSGTAVAIAVGAYYAPLISGVAAAALCVVLTVGLTEVFGLPGAAAATVMSYSIAAFVVWLLAFNHSKFSKREGSS